MKCCPGIYPTNMSLPHQAKRSKAKQSISNSHDPTNNLTHATASPAFHTAAIVAYHNLKCGIKMPYLETAQSWLTQSTLLIQARPSTVCLPSPIPTPRTRTNLRLLDTHNNKIHSQASPSAQNPLHNSRPRYSNHNSHPNPQNLRPRLRRLPQICHDKSR